MSVIEATAKNSCDPNFFELKMECFIQYQTNSKNTENGIVFSALREYFYLKYRNL